MSDTYSEPMEVIELHISERELVTYALLAHEEDITLNQWFLNAVMARIGELDVKQDTDKQGSEAESSSSE